jgi:putative endonuclease
MPDREPSASRKGRMGEDAACAYLEGTGWSLLARNYRTKSGEIDIIGLQGDSVAFFEVKSWDRCSLEDLEYAIDARKRKRIVETSKIFLDRHRQYNCVHVRYDVLFVSRNGASVRHIESAFTE